MSNEQIIASALESLRSAMDPTTLPRITFEAMTEALDRFERARKSTINATVAAEIASQFQDLVYHMFLGNGSDVWICARITDSQQIVDLRRAVASRGYKLDRMLDFPNQQRRTYIHDGIIFDANFTTNENARCKYVQKGVKEVPLYELVCDEE